jgi:hypothetical protein
MDRRNNPEASNQTREIMDKETAYKKTLHLYLESEFMWKLSYIGGVDTNDWRKAVSKYQGYRTAMIDADILTWEDTMKIEKHTVKIEKPE